MERQPSARQCFSEWPPDQQPCIRNLLELEILGPHLPEARNWGRAQRSVLINPPVTIRLTEVLSVSSGKCHGSDAYFVASCGLTA